MRCRNENRGSRNGTARDALQGQVAVGEKMHFDIGADGNRRSKLDAMRARGQPEGNLGWPVNTFASIEPQP